MSTAAAQYGRANPLRRARGTATDSGDTTIISAPGTGLRLVIYYFKRARTNTTDVTVLVKEGSTTVDSDTLTSELPGIIEQYGEADAVRLAANAALVLNLSGAASVAWKVHYRIEAA